METFAFSLSSKWVALSSVASLGVSILACPLQALAQNASINAIQLSVEVAPISVSGTRLGGSVSASGNGLSNAPTLPVLNSTGETQAMTATAFQTAAGATFNFDVSARAADGPALSGGGSAAPLGGGFGSQSGRFSAGGTGSLAFDAGNVASVSAGSGSGVTATAIFSTTMNTGANEAQVRRVATSSNNQATFTAERQGARYQHGGSGLTAVAAGTGGVLAAAGLGATPTITVSTGGLAATGAGVAFTRTEAVQTGQASAALSATAATPAYGITTNTIGGATAGTITSTNMNTVGVTVGGAGTSSSLSVIQSLTAF